MSPETSAQAGPWAVKAGGRSSQRMGSEIRVQGLRSREAGIRVRPWDRGRSEEEPEGGSGGLSSQHSLPRKRGS